MSLAEQLDELRNNVQTEMSEEAKEVSARAIKDLDESGILERCLVKGNKAPDFTLPGANRALVNIGTLLIGGPVVLSFFRGGW